MSKIILIPSSLPQEYPDASISTPQRLRILAQVRQYIIHESTIIIDKVPTVTSQQSTPVKVDIFSGVVPGTIVNIDALYDGDTINPVEIYEVNGANFTPDNLQLIED
ncbi:hypothetical protein Cantr_03600 [Candida viswanathii]|uniref:Replication factor A protein 3 n=1 Tax=Candida viswanathii TaxID=5486 RepID=A0A367YL06_9ASCO|nr:hypothetical protein Cantr_03576 [Candida viswanathii]RCK66574.1 hypothetical protein Cantr_03590 [Candida viswanathii]RCK66583.1 hypothetical protein Cantr_03600 [Candida viswanathii]